MASSSVTRLCLPAFRLLNVTPSTVSRRFISSSTPSSFSSIFMQQQKLACRNCTVFQFRYISTTEKKKDGITVHQDDVHHHPKLNSEKYPDTNYVARKDWVSRGVDVQDEDYDVWGWYTVMALTVSVVICFTFWFTAYSPVMNIPHRDWITREAFLELHRREKYGLPLIDPDLVPRENIILPPEEDLKDFEVTL